MHTHPVFDCNRHDADKATLAHPIGTAGTPEEALAVVRNFFAKVDDGGDPITVYAAELETVGNTTGWFPIWR